MLRCIFQLMAQSGVLLLRIDMSGFGGKAEIDRRRVKIANDANDPQRK